MPPIKNDFTEQQLAELVPSIRRYAYSLTGSMPDADDLLQTTLERLMTKSIPEGAVLAAWAFRICRNSWIDEHRGLQVRESAVHEPSLQAAQSVDGEQDIHSQMTLDKVHQAMAHLKDDQRAVVGLVAVEGLSYKEVAAVLEVPVGTVMSRLARARAALSALLAGAY